MRLKYKKTEVRDHSSTGDHITKRPKFWGLGIHISEQNVIEANKQTCGVRKSTMKDE